MRGAIPPFPRLHRPSVTAHYSLAARPPNPLPSVRHLETHRRSGPPERGGRGRETLAERNKFATKAIGIKGRSRPTLQSARLPRHRKGWLTMAAQEVSLSASDHAALADGFRPLEAVNPGLPDRLVRYVTEGYDESVLSALASTPNAAELLGMDFSYGGLPPPSRQTPLPTWDALLQHHGGGARSGSLAVRQGHVCGAWPGESHRSRCGTGRGRLSSSLRPAIAVSASVA